MVLNCLVILGKEQGYKKGFDFLKQYRFRIWKGNQCYAQYYLVFIEVTEILF